MRAGRGTAALVGMTAITAAAIAYVHLGQKVEREVSVLVLHAQVAQPLFC